MVWMDVCKIYRPISHRDLYYVCDIKKSLNSSVTVLSTTLLIGATVNEEETNIADSTGMLFPFKNLQNC